MPIFSETADGFSQFTTTTTTNNGSTGSYAASNPSTHSHSNEASPTRCCEQQSHHTVTNTVRHIHLHPPPTASDPMSLPANCCSESGLHSRGSACLNRTDNCCSTSNTSTTDADATEHDITCERVSIPWRMWLKRTNRVMQDIPWHQLRHVKWKNQRAFGRSAYVPTDVSFFSICI